MTGAADETPRSDPLESRPHWVPEPAEGSARARAGAADLGEAQLRQRLQQADANLHIAREQLAEAREQLRSMRASTSWRITAPLRAFRRRSRPHG